MLSVSFTQKAKEDIFEIVAYFMERSDSVSDRFLQSLDHTTRFLADNPEVGEVFYLLSQKYSNIRTWRVSNFPKHVVFYQRNETEIVVLRIIHSSRDIEAIMIREGL